MSKKFPDLRSDEEADAWLQSADLSEYDLSGMKKVRFELARKDASISLRLPAALLATLKANAAKANMPTQRLIRMMIEAQLAETGAGPKRKPRRQGDRASAPLELSPWPSVLPHLRGQDAGVTKSRLRLFVEANSRRAAQRVGDLKRAVMCPACGV